MAVSAAPAVAKAVVAAARLAATACSDYCVLLDEKTLDHKSAEWKRRSSASAAGLLLLTAFPT